MPSDGGHGIFAKWRENFAKLTNLPSSFANLLEAVFYGFVKNPRMSSTFSKLLELLKSLLHKSGIYHKQGLQDMSAWDGLEVALFLNFEKKFVAHPA